MTQIQDHPSPSWGTNTKLVVALTIIVVVGALLANYVLTDVPLVPSTVIAIAMRPPFE